MASRLAEDGPMPAARHLSKRASSRVELLTGSRIYELPRQAKKPDFEASSWTKRLAKFFSEAFQTVGPLRKMPLNH